MERERMMRTFCLYRLKMSTAELHFAPVNDLIPWLPVLAVLILLLAALEWLLGKIMDAATKSISKHYGHLFTKNVLRSIAAVLFTIAALIWWFGGVKTGAFR